MNLIPAYHKFILRSDWATFFLFATLLLGQVPSLLNRPESNSHNQQLSFKPATDYGQGESLMPDHFAHHAQSRPVNLFIRDFDFHLLSRLSSSGNSNSSQINPTSLSSWRITYLTLQVFRI